MSRALERRLRDLEKRIVPRNNIIEVLSPAIRDWYDTELTKLDPEARLTAYQIILDSRYREVWERIKPGITVMLNDWANSGLGTTPEHKPLTDEDITRWESLGKLKRRLVYVWRTYGKTRLTIKDRKRLNV